MSGLVLHKLKEKFVFLKSDFTPSIQTKSLTEILFLLRTLLSWIRSCGILTSCGYHLLKQLIAKTVTSLSNITLSLFSLQLIVYFQNVNFSPFVCSSYSCWIFHYHLNLKDQFLKILSIPRHLAPLDMNIK